MARLSHSHFLYILDLLMASMGRMGIFSEPQIKTHAMKHDLLTVKCVCN